MAPTGIDVEAFFAALAAGADRDAIARPDSIILEQVGQGCWQIGRSDHDWQVPLPGQHRVVEPGALVRVASWWTAGQNRPAEAGQWTITRSGFGFFVVERSAGTVRVGSRTRTICAVPAPARMGA